MSRMNLSGYVGHVTVFSWMFSCVLFSSKVTVRIRVRIRFRLVSCYAHVFVLL